MGLNDTRSARKSNPKTMTNKGNHRSSQDSVLCDELIQFSFTLKS